MTEWTLRRVVGDDIVEAWVEARSWIDVACKEEGGSYLPSDILAAIIRGDMQMWVACENATVRAVAVTEIRVHPQRKTFWVLMMVGEALENWSQFRHLIAEWAKSQGCEGKRAMKSLARRGYAKLFKEYQCTHVLLERDL